MPQRKHNPYEIQTKMNFKIGAYLFIKEGSADNGEVPIVELLIPYRIKERSAWTYVKALQSSRGFHFLSSMFVGRRHECAEVMGTENHSGAFPGAFHVFKWGISLSI